MAYRRPAYSLTSAFQLPINEHWRPFGSLCVTHNTDTDIISKEMIQALSSGSSVSYNIELPTISLGRLHSLVPHKQRFHQIESSLENFEFKFESVSARRRTRFAAIGVWGRRHYTMSNWLISSNLFVTFAPED